VKDFFHRKPIGPVIETGWSNVFNFNNFEQVFEAK